MLIKLLRYIAGYVIFTGKGGFSERFINLCASRRINIWDVTCFEGSIKAKTGLKDFKKLRDISRKTGVRVKIDNKRGLPFYLKNHRDRVGLLIGAVFFMVFCVAMNRFVWCINSTDSENFSREQIIEAAENAGLHYGVYVSNFDEEKAAREIFQAFDGKLSWVKVNIKGSLAVIEYREKLTKMEMEEKGQPSNLIADFDGVIISDETYQGAKNISKGNAVKKGDILISGIVEGVDLKPLYYEAKGKFTALHSDYSEVSLKNSSEFFCYTGVKEFYTICFFGLKIPFGFVSDSAEKTRVFNYERFIEYDGFILPFSIIKTTVTSCEKATVTKENLHLLAIMNYSDYTYDKYKNTNIISSEISVNSTNSGVTVSGEYQCIDFIGESKPIIIENSEN